MKRSDIVLIGFMGCGKTTVGMLLARMLSVPFLDTDERIEQIEGMKISRLFREKGEDYFRDAETGLIEELLSGQQERVISTGGGMPLRPVNAGLLKDLGSVVYLKASAGTVYERLKGKTDRPLLAGSDPLGKIRMLLEQREPLYEAAADIVVGVDQKSPYEIADEVVEAVRECRARKKVAAATEKGGETE